MQSSGAAEHCPRCGEKGRKVGSITLRSLLSAEAKKRFDENDTFLFCKTKTCDIVYFDTQRREQLRQGLDRCEETNPQGSCCLGNVRQIANAAITNTAQTREEPSSEEQPACCCSSSEEP